MYSIYITKYVYKRPLSSLFIFIKCPLLFFFTWCRCSICVLYYNIYNFISLCIPYHLKCILIKKLLCKGCHWMFTIFLSTSLIKSILFQVRLCKALGFKTIWTRWDSIYNLYSFWKYWPFYLTTALMVFVISAQKYLKVHPNLRIFSCPTHKLSVKQDEKFRSMTARALMKYFAKTALSTI